MSTQSMNLPINIPWKLIAASPDMLDTKFCNKRFPYAWRSSLAISAYEPNPEELPKELCGDLISYLKITCSITGYQPSKEETEKVYNSFPDLPTEDQRQVIESIINEYFACYGVLLNVAVFPTPEYIHYLEEFKSIDFADFKKISELPNPLTYNDITFEAANTSINRTVDIYPANGDEKPELDLFKKMKVTIPLSFEVRAAVVYLSTTNVVMKAYYGNNFIAEQKTGPLKGHVYELIISHEGGIDNIIFESSDNKAALLKLSLYHRLARPKEFTIDNLPRIIDFEPKLRDLYQSATESGELLTASNSGINTDKSFTHTESSETGIDLGAKLTAPLSPDGRMAEVSGSLSHKWGETDSDSRTIQTSASLERQESQSTTTTLNQMYNLLTGYHPGTNRAVFLMLPRPHILQPTDRRSFIQGVRMIEGVQDFFLIISRPKSTEGLCVEAFLETAHFPEEVNIIEPSPEYEYKSVDFEHGPFTAKKPGFLGKRNEVSIDKTYSGFIDAIGGWYLDPTNGTPGRGGIECIEKYSGDNADGPDTGGASYPDLPRMEDYFYNMENPDTAIISGKIRSGVTFDVEFHRKYRVYLRKQKQMTLGPHADISGLLITSRGLCTCFKSVKNCFETIKISLPINYDPKIPECIVAEVPIKMSGSLFTGTSTGAARLPAVKELLRKIQFAMSTSWRLPNRMPFGEMGFLDSDYFKERIKKILPSDIYHTRIKDINDLPPSLIKGLGEECTIEQALKLDLAHLMKKTGLTVKEAALARRILLGIRTQPEPPSSEKQNESDPLLK